MKIRFALISSLFFLLTGLIYPWDNRKEFEYAKRQFQKNNYTIAEVYFRELKTEGGPYQPLSAYYLIRIYHKREDILRLINEAHHFLEDYPYDNHTDEVFKILLSTLIEHSAYEIAAEYIKKFDQSRIDDKILMKIAVGLYSTHPEIADELLGQCSQTDTVKILRAMLRAPDARSKFFESISGNKGLVYQVENMLQLGDTVEAYLKYQEIEDQKLTDGLLYRTLLLALIFEPENIHRYINRLAGEKGYREEVRSVEELLKGKLHIYPEFKCQKLLSIFNLFHQDTVIRNIPEEVEDAGLLIDSVNIIKRLRELRQKYTDNFYLDSLYCEVLLKKRLYLPAYRIIKRYIAFRNTSSYARKVRALFYYYNRNYKSAARDIIMSNPKEPESYLLLAECLEHQSLPAVDFYRQAYYTAKDDSLRFRAFKGLVNCLFKEDRFPEILKYKQKDFLADTELVKVYVCCLLRMGRLNLADSLMDEFSLMDNCRWANYYGEFLIEKKRFGRADAYYDSVIGQVDSICPELYYNYARVALLQGKTDTALQRFKSFIDKFPRGDYYYNALFKIATINFLNQNFDSAGLYYGLAARKGSLRYDALKNRLLCYKKSGNWKKACETAKQLLEIGSPGDEAEIYFDIGYALLQDGQPDSAQKYLSRAVRAIPTPEYIYWLAEAYLARADFGRALYQYQRIVADFPGAGMWRPTAQYKSGLMLEFMGRYDEARKIYQTLIRTRGKDDTWAKESRKRLTAIKGR